MGAPFAEYTTSGLTVQSVKGGLQAKNEEFASFEANLRTETAAWVTFLRYIGDPDREYETGSAIWAVQ